MGHSHYLEQIVISQKRGIPCGICSICSAHPFVIEAALEYGLQTNSVVLIEATCNQVNQFGGYIGMTPRDFVTFVHGIADSVRFPRDQLILGGDHLGPSPWQKEPTETALPKAADLVKAYVDAGFTKIHLDPSMYLADDIGDRTHPLDARIVAERTALLCSVAEKTFRQQPQKDRVPPVYVIGTEVPIPGGITDSTEELRVTTAASLIETVAVTQAVFQRQQLSEAWKRVIAIVVQPGVEFGDQTIYPYQHEKAQDLCQTLHDFPTLIFEGHSTDYQQGVHLQQMVEDGIAILKVGPALTFVMREAIFALCHVEQELATLHPEFQPSQLMEVLDATMVNHPGYWQPYYHGNARELQFARKYSLSDRSRYYWNVPEVQAALNRLLSNIREVGIPFPLLSQFLPRQAEKIGQGELESIPQAIIKAAVKQVLNLYARATTPGT